MSVIKSFTRDLRGALHLRFSLAEAPLRLLPVFASGYLRSHLYRRVGGLKIGHGTFIMGRLRVIGGTRGHINNVSIGSDVLISTDVVLNPDGAITIGNGVTIGPFVKIYTSTHKLGPSSRRCLPGSVSKPVVIEEGCWIAIGATILPGVTVGRGSVIAGGSVVSRDVEPNSQIEGAPAQLVRMLPGDP
jgi:acetyltransferase-like isoleucine patch superfamily enzyme